MDTRYRFRLLVAGLAAFAMVRGASGLGATTPLASVVPEQAVLCLEVYRPQRLLDALLSPAFADRIKSLPAYEQWRATPQFQGLVNVATFLEATLQTNWQATVRKVTKEGLAFALGGENRYLLVLDGESATSLERLHTVALQVARSEAEKQGQSERVHSVEYGGITGWTFDGRQMLAVISNRFLAASDAAVLKGAVDLRSSNGAGSFAELAGYRAARKTLGEDVAAMLFVDLAKLHASPAFLQALDQQRQNPMTALLFAEIPELLKAAQWLALGFYVDDEALSVRVFLEGDRGARSTFSFAKLPGGRGLARNLEVPRQIAGLNLYRDLAGFYAAKDTLFPQRTSGLIFFENMMGIFFSGRNLTDEVLAGTQPRVQLVVARQDYDPQVGIPEPQFPAFAVVFELRDPDRFGEVVEEAWQKALGLINFTRGQKALPGMIIDQAEHHGTRITLARYSAKDVADRKHADARFNFRPALAFAHGHAILSSTDQLARDLVDALAQEPASAQPSTEGVHSVLQLGGGELSAVLRANRATLVQGNMLKEGKTQPEAEAAIDTFCSLAGWIDRASLRVGSPGRGAVAELRLSFRKP